MTHQASLPLSLRSMLDRSAREHDMSLSAYVARMLSINLRENPVCSGFSSPHDEAMCKPFSLRLPSSIMLPIQDGALHHSHTINTEIVNRLTLAMRDEAKASLNILESAAWVTLCGAIDAVTEKITDEKSLLIAQLKVAKRDFVMAMTPQS